MLWVEVVYEDFIFFMCKEKNYGVGWLVIGKINVIEISSMGYSKEFRLELGNLSFLLG